MSATVNPANISPLVAMGEPFCSWNSIPIVQTVKQDWNRSPRNPSYASRARRKTPVAKLFAIVAYVLGLAGAGLFFAYVVATGTGYWPRDSSSASPLGFAINAGMLCIFALQHSAMQRQRVLRLPDHLERSAYVGASGLALGTLT